MAELRDGEVLTLTLTLTPTTLTLTLTLAPNPEPRARARALTQVLTLDHDGAESAFASLRPKLPEKERGQAADEWLFNVFATAAIRAAADGGVWKA